MLNQNSSKSYPQIIFCHNTHSLSHISVQVLVRGQVIALSSKDFFQLTPIINLQNVPDIKNSGLLTILYNQNSLKMFHIFLYYCIKVDTQIQIQGLDQYYLKQLGDLYVNASFNIQIGKFASLCSFCIKMQARKCAHVIYYLIYGRLATNSYISSLISQASFKKENKRQKLKKMISSKILCKKQLDTRSLLNYSQQQQVIAASDELAADLKQIFHGIQSDKQNKGKAKKHISQKSQRIQFHPQFNKEEKQKNIELTQESTNYFMNYFPKRVLNQEKSAIFEKIYPSYRSHYKFMRKKKFDDSKVQKMLDITYNNQSKMQRRDENQAIKPLVNQQKNKNYTHNVLKTSEKFKNTTSELDKIRSTITKEKRKTQNHFMINNNLCISQNQRLYLQLLEKTNKNQNNFKLQVHDINLTQYQTQNKFMSLLRKQQKNNKYQDEDSQEKCLNEKFLFDNLRNNQQENYSRAFHSQCQNRLFKYKNQYRKFMKIHLFKNEND